MLKKLLIALGIEWFVGLLGLGIAGANVSIGPAIALALLLVGVNATAVKILDGPRPPA